MARIRLAALTVVAVTGLTATGCGSSTHNTPARPTRISAPTPVSAPGQNTIAKKTNPLKRAQLIAKADAICGRNKARRKLLRSGVSRSFVAILPQLTAYEQAFYHQLATLTPPAAMTGDWNQMVAFAQTMAESTAEVNRDAQTNTTKGVQQLFMVFDQARRQFQSSAMHSGVPVCAQY